MRYALIGLVTFGLLAGLSSAGGQEPAKGLPPVEPAAKESAHRLVWEHADKLCRFVDQGDDTWAEVDKDGRIGFQFRETRRNCDFVDLLDKTRGYTVRLYADAAFMKGGNDGLPKYDTFTKCYDGKWVK